VNVVPSSINMSTKIGIASDRRDIPDEAIIRMLNEPQTVRFRYLEGEKYEKLIKAAEAKGVSKNEITVMWMEVVNRKDYVRVLINLPYEVPVDVGRVEKAALVRIFKDWHGFCWAKNFGWVGQAGAIGREEIDPCEATSPLYDGLTIEKNEVVEGRDPTANVRGINFAGFGCEGAMGDQLSRLEKCEFLHLHWNLIFGLLPPNLGNLVSLTSLDLSSNLIEGGMDADSFRRLTSLTTLDLSFNSLTGPIPDVFDRVSQLTVLNLAGNSFGGNLPPTLSKLVQLQELKLYNNQLTGDIPETMSCLQNLKKVNISQNVFTSGANSFNGLVRLQSLELSKNQLRGRIAPSIGGLKRLELLYLHNNQMSGLIPPEICTLTRLKRLNLAHNNFRGLIPFDIGNMTSLETLLLTGNNIIGPVPLSIARLDQLRDFHVFRNYPSELATMPVAFDRHAFKRLFTFGPSYGINSMNWDFEQVYGRPRDARDDDSVTIFSGKL